MTSDDCNVVWARCSLRRYCVPAGVCLSSPTGQQHRSNLATWVSPGCRLFRGGPSACFADRAQRGSERAKQAIKRHSPGKGEGRLRARSVSGSAPLPVSHVQHIGLVARWEGHRGKGCERPRRCAALLVFGLPPDPAAQPDRRQVVEVSASRHRPRHTSGWTYGPVGFSGQLTD